VKQVRSAYQDLKDHVAGDCPQCVPSARLPEMCDQGKQLWDRFNTGFDAAYPGEES
jgi:hypothetical protein